MFSGCAGFLSSLQSLAPAIRKVTRGGRATDARPTTADHRGSTGSPQGTSAAARLLVVASPAADADRFVAVEGLLLLEQQEEIEQLEQRVQRAWSSKPCCLPSAAGAADAAGAVGAVQAAAGSTWRVSCACRADLEGSTRGVCRLVAGRAWKCRAMRNSCRRTAHARRTRCGAGAGSAGGGRSNRSASGVAVTARTCVAWPRLSLGRLDVGGRVDFVFPAQAFS